MAGTVFLDEVFAMLDACAPGHTRRQGDHYWRVTHGDKVYPTLPTGAKSDKRKEIQLQKVVKMVQVLGVDPRCVMEHLPQLRGALKGRSSPE